jgi:hypothetical protein
MRQSRKRRKRDQRKEAIRQQEYLSVLCLNEGNFIPIRSPLRYGAKGGGPSFFILQAPRLRTDPLCIPNSQLKPGLSLSGWHARYPATVPTLAWWLVAGGLQGFGRPFGRFQLGQGKTG